jgi:hypothetical protein
MDVAGTEADVNNSERVEFGSHGGGKEKVGRVDRYSIINNSD